MSQTRARASRTVVGVHIILAALTLVVFALVLPLSNWPDGSELWVAVWVFAALIAAMRFPTPASTGDSAAVVLLDTCVIIAGVLLLDPATVMVIVAVGALVGQLWVRRPGQQITLNTLQSAMQAGVAGLVVFGARQLDPDAATLSAFGIGTVVAAGMAMHVVNVLAVGGSIALEERLPVLSTIWPMLHGFDAGQRLAHMGQWVLGLIAVVLAEAHPLGFLLLLVPVGALYIMQVRYNQMLRQAQRTLRGTEASLTAAQRIAGLGSWELELAHDTWHWSDELFRIFGFAQRAFQASRSRYLDVVHPDDRARVRNVLDRVAEHGVAETLDYRITHQDGDERVVHVRVEPIFSSSGNVQSVIGTVLDVTERKQLETRLSHQAYHDPLTGLSNRTHFLEALQASRSGGTNAVLFVDLDNFKDVNDRLGHDAGDRLLCVVAERLRHCLRDDDVAARMGGDEFTVLLRNVASPFDPERVSQRILRSLSEPIVVDGQSLLITPSIGIATSTPTDHGNPEDLLRAADAAMYRAKRAGKARVAVSDTQQATIPTAVSEAAG